MTGTFRCNPYNADVAIAQVGVQMLLLWMLYFFTGMALRESVLKVNGSAIRPWSASNAPWLTWHAAPHKT